MSPCVPRVQRPCEKCVYISAFVRAFSLVLSKTFPVWKTTVYLLDVCDRCLAGRPFDVCWGQKYQVNVVIDPPRRFAAVRYVHVFLLNYCWYRPLLSLTAVTMQQVQAVPCSFCLHSVRSPKSKRFYLFIWLVFPAVCKTILLIRWRLALLWQDTGPSLLETDDLPQVLGNRFMFLYKLYWAKPVTVQSLNTLERIRLYKFLQINILHWRPHGTHSQSKWHVSWITWTR